MDEESAVVGIVPLTLATGELDEAVRAEIILLLLLKAAVDAAPNDRAAKTAPGKNLIVLLLCDNTLLLVQAFKCHLLGVEVHHRRLHRAVVGARGERRKQTKEKRVAREER